MIGAAAAPTATAPGWPLVVYFHRVTASIGHYTALTPTAFAHGLDLLGEKFQPLDPRSAARTAQAPARGAPRCLVTIDDGWRDGLRGAAPLLEERGWRAVFFVPTADVGGPGRLSWAELAELRDRGHVIASHGHRHRRFDELDARALRREVRRSLSLLGENLGEAPPLLAFPYGRVPSPGARREALRGLLLFGTAKSDVGPWSVGGTPIRRAYLPTGRTQGWPELVRSWKEDWCGARSRS